MGRAGPTAAGSNTSSAPRGPYALALRGCLLLVLTGFLVELGFVARQPGALGSASLRGLLAGLGLGVVLVLPCSVLIGGLFSAVGTSALADGVRARLAWLWEHDAERQQPRVAGVLAALVLAALGLPLAFFVARSLILGIARPHFAATAIVVAHLALGGLALLAFPGLRGLCRALVVAGQRTPLRWLLARAGNVLGLLATLAVLALAALFASYWSIFVYLPWRTLAATLGALALVASWLALAPRLGRAGAAVELLLLSLGVSAGVGALFGIGGAGQAARAAMRDTLVGELSNRVALLALDFDRDGTLPVLGGDCAPFDPLRSPLAIDIPGNGVDEDCDGADLDARLLGAEVKHDHALPADFPARPTVVLLTVDAFAASRMKAFGYARSVTPHIDAFARRGTFFRYGFAQGPSTRLSFPAMFTSRWDTQIAQRVKRVTGH